ncbi:MAG: homoserine O-acetyltransferase [Acidobacteriota bacterium]
MSDSKNGSGSPSQSQFPQLSPAAIQVVDETPFELEYGEVLPRLEICYESWGELSAERDNAILLCPSFSGHSHASSHTDDPTPGWWEGLIGPGLAFDTDRNFVLCPSLLGGACGTTGPVSIDPSTGLAYGDSFPTISVHDIVNVHVRLLDLLKIDHLFAVAGGSLGAMQSLELAMRHPGRVGRVLAFAGTDRTRPYTAGIHHIGRRAIQLGRRCGDDESIDEGLRLAREIGTLFYRSRTEFNQRFSWNPSRKPDRERSVFEVESYLEHQGYKAVGKFNLDAYLILSMAMDLHDVWKGSPSSEETLEDVSAEFLNVSAEEDHLIPTDEQLEFHQRLDAAGKRSHWCSLPSIVGHDSFLVEKEKVSELVEEFFAGSLQAS